jgi:hypothetical protein
MSLERELAFFSAGVATVLPNHVFFEAVGAGGEL